MTDRCKADNEKPQAKEKEPGTGGRMRSRHDSRSSGRDRQSDAGDPDKPKNNNHGNHKNNSR